MRTKLKDIPTLHKHGEIGNGRSRDDKNENVNSIDHQGSNGQPYRIAKLKRDYPAIAERLALQLEPLLAAKAKQNQVVNGQNRQNVQNSAHSVEPIKTRDEVAKVAGVSHDTVANTHNPITTIRHLPKILMIFDPKTGKYTCQTLGKRGKEIDETL